MSAADPAADQALPPAPDAPAPLGDSGRITNLDALRGVAVFGILLMNAVSYGLDPAAYFNINLANDSPADWVVGIFGELFVDQRFMAMFSLLFGAGIVLFADRADAKGRSGLWLSLWRNLLLLGIGALHMLLWSGDVLMLYAICAPFLLLSRRLSDRALFTVGAVVVLSSALVFAGAQALVDADGSQLGELWFAADSTNGQSPDEDLEALFLFTFFLRALGMMLIGVALFRSGLLSGGRSTAFYQRTAVIGLGVGIPLAAAGVLIAVLSDFDPQLALISMIPNTVGTIPAALGFGALIILWNQRADTPFRRRLHAVGRMALTNYLTQTILGVVILEVALGDAELNRILIFAFIGCVWLLQLWWSEAWLSRFRYGPFEWLWRVLTYRSMQPLRR